MISTLNTTSAINRSIAFLCACSLAITPAWAMDLADAPMAVKNTVLPNMIFILDDSGSMDSEVLFPTNDGAAWWHTGDMSFVGRGANDQSSAGTINFNKTGGAGTTWKKYVYLFPNGTGTGNRAYSDSTNDHYAIPPTAEFAWTRSSKYNPIYYDTNKTYTYWPEAHNGSSSVSFSAATATSVKSHPVLNGNTIDLTTDRVSNSTNFTFKMHEGMVAPAGARRLNGSNWVTLSVDTTVPSGSWDVEISYYPATFYHPDPNGTFTGPDGAKLKRYEIKSGNSFPSGRTYAAEIQNFANWFAFYRKRKLLMSSAIGSVFDGLDGIRGGMFTLNDRSSVSMYDFSSTTASANEKRLLYNFYSNNNAGGTPTRDALNYAGTQFKRTNSGAPIQFECQYNAAFVLTDGFANRTPTDLPSPRNFDGQTDYGSYPYNRQYKANGSTVTSPYQDTYEGTLADIAMEHYTKNLRPDLPTGKVPVNQYDVGPDADRNPNLHMNTYALGLGTKGFIFGVDAATTADPYTNAPAWSDPNAADRSPAAVDDLWHATINGHGEMFSVTDVDAARQSIKSVVDSIIGKVGSAAAVAVSNPNVTTADNASYVTAYNSGNWTGDLLAYPLDLTTGNTNFNLPLWSVSPKLQLDARTTARLIASYSGTSGTGNGRAFTSAGLSTAQKDLIKTPASSPSDADDVIAFLRGTRTLEGTTYRSRVNLLGDMINAEPAILRDSFNDYTDNGYSAFKTSTATRTRMVLQGANDGMLHAFNANTGAEAWAYVPNRVIQEGNLNMLSRKTGFTHKYFVDATPTIADVDFKNIDGATGSGEDWRTILVGGLGKGGKGFYALDLTSPGATTDSEVAAKVLWEFPNSATNSTASKNIGYSYGRPVIAKFGGKWYVMVSSGYDNGALTGGDGKGYLFLLNPATGAIEYSFPTTAGSSADPSGLAHLTAYIDDVTTDATVKYVYGGDLKGNVWRFDFTKNSISNATVTKLATLVDSSGNFQPVTTAPSLAEVTVSGVSNRFVYVGTGRYLGDSDIPGSSANIHATQTQSIYGLMDIGTEITSLRSSLQAQTLGATTAGYRTLSNTTVDYATKKGWYVDLPISGERINNDPVLSFGILAFTSNIPSSDPCSPGGSSYLNFFDYKTGGTVSTASYSSKYLGNALASRPILVKLPSGQIKVIVRMSDATNVTEDFPAPTSSSGVNRVSWRELMLR